MMPRPAKLPGPGLSPADLNGLVMFARLAQTLNFTAAARLLGISPSAVSQAIRALETRMGTTLVQRTTRQVGLTEAGEALLAGLMPALAEIEAAIATVDMLGSRVSGRLRLNAPRAVAPILWRELLVPFGAEHPELEIELHASDSLDAVFAEGFDAGVRLGDDLELDVTAFRLTEPIPVGVFASPAFLNRVGRPESVGNLDPAQCIQFVSTLGATRTWTLLEHGQRRDFLPAGRIVVHDAISNMTAAAAGGGFAYGAAPVATELVAQGRLEPVLAEASLSSPGLFLYYPSAKRTPPKLRALIGFVERHGRYKAAVMPPSTNTAAPVR
jgi:DNA-binding transcriptional LysR family regulator